MNKEKIFIQTSKIEKKFSELLVLIARIAQWFACEACKQKVEGSNIERDKNFATIYVLRDDKLNSFLTYSR